MLRQPTITGVVNPMTQSMQKKNPVLFSGNRNISSSGYMHVGHVT